MIRLPLFVTFFVLVASSATEPNAALGADFRDGFEAPHTGWLLAEADCGVQVQIHVRTYREAHTGSGSEFLRLKTGPGSQVNFVYPLDGAPVIAEFAPRLWVKASRPGIQFWARAVLPRTRDPQTGKPLTAPLRGDDYTDVGSWQNLAIKDVRKSLQQQVVLLRTKYGKDIDDREAYIDLIAINAYTGETTLDCWLDDLELPGYVPAKDRGNSLSVDAAGTPAGRVASLQGSLLMVDGRPMFPRVVEGSLTSLDQARQLGFHAVKLPVTPPAEWLREAQRTRLWLIVPPPHRISGSASEYSSVLAWNLCVHLSDKERASTKQLVDEVRRADPHRGRPVLMAVDADLSGYSRLGGIVTLDRPTPGTSAELAELRQTLTSKTEFLRPGTPFWGTVHLPPLASVAQQIEHLAPDFAPIWDADPETVRLQAFAALQTGAHGLVVKSALPLDESPAGMLRADVLKLLNLELAPLDPWTSSHVQVYAIDTGDPLTHAIWLQAERSRLVLLSRHAPAAQYAPGPPAHAQVTLTMPGVPMADRAYQITSAGLKQLRTAHSSGGIRVNLEDVGLTAAVVVTQDALAVQHLSRILSDTAMTTARLRWDIARRRTDLVEDVHRILTQQGHPLSVAASQLREARGNLTQAEALLNKNDPAGPLPFLLRAEHAIAKVRRGHWEQTAAAFPSLAASPCCAEFSTLPLHWELAERLKQSKWLAASLPGGELNDLPTLIDSGWKQQRHVPRGVAAEVAVVATGQRGGQGALQLLARKDGADPAELIERPIAWITSPAVQVAAGQIARIHGWVNVPQQIVGSHDGLLIFDSLAGPELADRVKRTQGWREFSLYRAAPKAGELRVTFALTGLGEAFVDDVSIQLLEGSSP